MAGVASTSKQEPKYHIRKADLEKLVNDLEQTVRQRDKALKKLNRLEQKVCQQCEIRGLRESNETLRAHIGNLNTDLELVGLRRDVACLRSTVDGKNVEISKLQSAEKELKEHLERDLAYLREENKQLKNSGKKGNPKLDLTCCFGFRFPPASVAPHTDTIAAAATKPLDAPAAKPADSNATAAKPADSNATAAKPADPVVPAAVHWETNVPCDPHGDVEPLWEELFPKHDSQDSCTIM